MAVNRRTTRTGLAAFITVAALALAGCSGGSGGGSDNSNSGAGASGKAVKGGVISFAEKSGAKPNYIFPFQSSAVASIYNQEWSLQMFRPLYYAPKGASPEYDYDISLAEEPTFSRDDKSVVINMRKNYKWSNGEPVNARDVIFYINMFKAAVKKDPSNFSNYTPGLFPDFLTSYKATGPYQVTLTMKRSFNPTWFKYNALNLIFPFPMAWDKTSDNGPTGKADLTPAGALKVFNYLSAAAKDTKSYTTSPLWKVVNGPWMLDSYSNSGRIVMKPNPKYDGPYKATITEFDWLPFTSDDAEFNQLRSGKLDIGYVPSSDIPQIPQLQRQGYTITHIPDFGFYYILPNFNNPKQGPIFHQLYFRQAFAHLVDQATYIKQIYKGYAQPEYGPVPVAPPNPYVSDYAKSNPFPFSVDSATALLKAHGWTIKPGGADVCTSPGTGADQCGAGIKKGQTLSFDYAYASGNASLSKQVPALKSDASKAGVDLNVHAQDFNTLISNNTACKPSQASCKWEMMEFGGITGIVYPSGEVLFQTGAGLNISSYSDKTADRLIANTIYGSDPNALQAYQDYITKQQPNWWTPSSDQIVAVKKEIGATNDAIKGITQNSLLPEQMYYTTKQ